MRKNISEFIPLKEAADHLGLQPRAVRRFVKRLGLPVDARGRISRAEFDALFPESLSDRLQNVSEAFASHYELRNDRSAGFLLQAARDLYLEAKAEPDQQEFIDLARAVYRVAEAAVAYPDCAAAAVRILADEPAQ